MTVNEVIEELRKHIEAAATILLRYDIAEHNKPAPKRFIFAEFAKQQHYDKQHGSNNKPLQQTHFDNRIKNTDFKAAKEEEMPHIWNDITVRLRGNSGLFEHRFTHEGKQHSVYGYSNKECWDKRMDIVSGKKATKKDITLGEWLIKWYSVYKTRKDGSKINQQTENYIKREIIPTLGKISLKSLTGFQIMDFLKNYDDKTNTRSKLATIIKSSLNRALGSRLIITNPFLAVEVERHDKKSYPVLHPGEQTLLLANIKNKKYLALFWLCCCTGMRIGEAIDSIPFIDYEKCIINVQGEDKKTKKHKRQIPFLPNLIKNEWKRLLPNVTARGAQLYFKRLSEKLNINFVIHSFRHTFASCCNHVGINYKQVQAWLGHRTSRMTTDVYTELLKNEPSPIIDYFKKLKEYLKI